MVRTQGGITLIGFAIMLCIVGFFAYTAMKLVPVYSTHMGVVKSMKLLEKEPGIEQKSIDEIRRDLSIKFDTQYVEDNLIPPQNIQLIKQPGGNRLRIFYDRRVPFVYNVDLLVHFDNTVNLSQGSAN